MTNIIKKILGIFNKTFKKVISSKKLLIITIIGMILVVFLGFKLFKKDTTETKYVLAVIKKGTLITSVSGTGQVSSSNQVDIQSKVASDVVYANLSVGQEVKKGQLLVQLNTNDAAEAVRDAEFNLESAKITLSKLGVTQKSGISDIEDSIATTKNNIEEAYQSGFNVVANAFLDLPTIISGLRGVLNDYTVGTGNRVNYAAYQDLVIGSSEEAMVASMISDAQKNYTTSYNKYSESLNDYRITTRYSEENVIMALIEETLDAVKTMAQSAKDEQNLLDTVSAVAKNESGSIPSTISQYQTSVSNYISKLNSHISSLNSAQNSIETYKQSLENYQEELENTKTYNPLDIASQQNTIKQRQATLDDAKESLANCYIRAPFNGVVAGVDIEKGQSVSNGATVATIIAEKQIVEIALNEVDIANVKIGQKSTLTFDAIEDLTISGEITQVDVLGSTSSGVVSYNVTILLDTQDDRVKSGMSTSATIVTEVKSDVLMISSSAIKSQGDVYYVLMPNSEESIDTTDITTSGVVLTKSMQTQQIEIGIANDSMTEVTSGLEEGDIIISKTVTSSSSSSSKSTTNSSDDNKSIFDGGAGGGMPPMGF
jgi:HlyD family secretion protein